MSEMVNDDYYAGYYEDKSENKIANFQMKFSFDSFIDNNDKSPEFKIKDSNISCYEKKKNYK